MKPENRKIIRPGCNVPRLEEARRWRDKPMEDGESLAEILGETMREWANDKNLDGFQEMLSYSDDLYMSTVVSCDTWLDIFGGGAADPCLSWLVKEGWISRDSFSNPQQIDFLAEIWKMGCQNALASQESQGAILNFRGAEILRVFGE